MALKHNITGMLTTNSSAWDLTSGINQSSSYVLSYAIIIIIFVAATFYLIRKTSDIGKSLVTSGFITTVISLMFFYGGKVYGVNFIPDLVMLGISIIFAFGLGLTIFLRYNKNENR